MDETTILILLLIILVIIVYSFYFINIKKCKKKTKEKFTTTDTCSAGNGWKTGGDLFCGDDNAFVCFIRRLVCYIKDLTNKRANVNNCMTDAGVNCREKIAQNNPDKYCSADYGKKCTNSLNDGAGSCDDCDTNCPPNQYADKIRYGVAAKSCTACPDYSSSPAGSALKTNCVCDSGYTGSLGGPCTSNPSSGGSSDASVSDCPPGQSGGPGSCTDCPANTYKSSSGNGACTPYTTCSEQNKVETTEGSTTAEPVCGECLQGYTLVSGDCVQCVSGTYKSFSGNGACTPCADGKYSNAVGAIAETTCTPYTTCSQQNKEETTRGSTTAQPVCGLCLQGYTQDSTSGNCVECGTGTYKDTVGNGNCTPCAANTYSNSRGATSQTTCTQCPAGETSTSGSEACSKSSGSASGTNQLLTSDTPGAMLKTDSSQGYICKAGFYQKYDADGNSLDECAYCPPNYYCPGEEVGQDNIVTDSGITRGAGLKVCPMRQNSEETVFGTAWTYDPYRTFTCGSDFDRNIDFWNVGYHEREGTSLKKNCGYDLLNGNSNFKFPRGGGAPDGTDSCAGQELPIEGLNYQCHLQTDEEDCLKLYNYQTDESRDTEILMNSKCSTDAQTHFPTFNDNRERYCCPNSRQTGNDQTGTYTDSLLGGTCQL